MVIGILVLFSVIFMIVLLVMRMIGRVSVVNVVVKLRLVFLGMEVLWFGVFVFVIGKLYW